jgi:hypothetical protein
MLPAAGRAVRPQIDAHHAPGAGQPAEAVEVPDAVAPAVGARQLLGLLAVGADLAGDPPGRALHQGLGGVGLAQVGQDHRGADVVPGAVVVGVVLLLDGERVGLQPLQKCGQPGAHRRLVGAGPAGRAAVEHGDGVERLADHPRSS